MEQEEQADDTVRSLRRCIRQLERGIITPTEAADKIFDVLAHDERYDLVTEAMRVLPPPAHERLKAIVAELNRPGAPYRTFFIGPCSAEAREAYDRCIHARFVHLAGLLQDYWNNNQPSSG